jgi:integrase
LRQLKKQSQVLEYLYILRFLIKGLEEGKAACGWKRIYIPSMPIAAPREPARFTPLTFRGLNNLAPYHAAMAAQLEHSPDGNPSRHLGLILLSAVMYGGMLSKEWMTPFLRALPDRVRISNGLMWVDMQRPYIYPKFADEAEKMKHVNRRWFPDPLTQALILRLHRQYREHLASCHTLDATFCLKTILKNLAGTPNPLSVNALCDAAACYLGLRIPGFLVSYATCKTISVSVPPRVWTRLLCDKTVVVDDVQEGGPSEETPGIIKAVVSNDNIDMRRQEKFRKQLTGILGEARRDRLTCEPTRRKVQEFFESTVHELSPVMQMLGQWAVELLTRLPMIVQGRKRRTALQPSSVATYLQAIDQELIGCAGKDDITQYESQELRDLYDDVIKSVKGKKKQNNSFRLTQFHRFLMRYYGAPEIDMSGMVGSTGPAELGVDANLVSPSQFRLVLRALGWEIPGRSRLQTIRCLIVILGYRCGLRRSEALCLRLVDIMGETFPEVIIRTSSLFRPKTPDSTRRIPVWLLLKPDELEALLHWKRLRMAEENDNNALSALLFGMAGKKVVPHEGSIYAPVQDALRQITGDATSRYHHLRHSFANRLLIMLLPDDMFHGALPKALKEMRADYETRERIIRGLFGNMDQGRQFLYGLSSLLGHSEIQTTLLSYVHLIDWLLGQAVRGHMVQPSLSEKATIQITGLKRAMVFRTKAESELDTWKMESFIERLCRHAAKYFPDPFAANAKEPPIVLPECDAEVATLPDWNLVSHSLRQHQERGMSAGEIAQMLRLDPDIVRSWCMTANSIRNMTTKEGTPRHLTSWQRKRVGETGIVNLFPAPPDNAADKSIVAKLLKKVVSLPVQDLEVVRAGCRSFIELYSSNQGFCRFTDFQGAVFFREFLKLVGVPDSMVYVSMFAKSTPPKPEELDEHRQVLKKLGIREDHLVRSGKRHVRYRRTHECSVGFMVAQASRTTKRENRKEAVETLYGFRYAVYLLAIGLGLTLEQSTKSPEAVSEMYSPAGRQPL